MFIIKKGVNASSFNLGSKTIILQAEPVINNVSDSDYALLMAKYGVFIKPRIFNEKTNPEGCFIVNENVEKAKDNGIEVLPEIVDNSAPIDIDSIDELKKKADSLGIKYSVNIGVEKLKDRINEKELENLENK